MQFSISYWSSLPHSSFIYLHACLLSIDFICFASIQAYPYPLIPLQNESIIRQIIALLLHRYLRFKITPCSAFIFSPRSSILSHAPPMASLLRLASLATLFAAALSLPHNEPRSDCSQDWYCSGNMGTPPARNMSALCSTTGSGYCNLGAYMVPRTTEEVTTNPSPGDVDLYIYDNACNEIGNLPSAFSASAHNSTLEPFDSELPWVVSVDHFAPPDGWGHDANIQFSYSTWTSPPLWNSGDSGYNDELNNSDDWFCWPTPSPTSGGATWLQVRISGSFPLPVSESFRPLTCPGVMSIGAWGTLRLTMGIPFAVPTCFPVRYGYNTGGGIKRVHTQPFESAGNLKPS